MREVGLRGCLRGRRKRTTRRDKHATPAPDLVQREFVASTPDRLWTADITYAHTQEGFVYLFHPLWICSKLLTWYTSLFSFPCPLLGLLWSSMVAGRGPSPVGQSPPRATRRRWCGRDRTPSGKVPSCRHLFCNAPVVWAVAREPTIVQVAISCRPGDYISMSSTWTTRDRVCQPPGQCALHIHRRAVHFWRSSLAPTISLRSTGTPSSPCVFDPTVAEWEQSMAQPACVAQRLSRCFATATIQRPVPSDTL